MSVTAKRLSKSGARGKEIDGLIREQLHIVDDKLVRAERTWGKNIVSYNLPTNLALPGLEKRDAQRIVYTAVVRSLKKRGFDVRLLLEEHVSTLYISWVTDLDTEEVQAMNQLLRTVRITRDKLSDFLGKNERSSGDPEAGGVSGRPQAPASAAASAGMNGPPNGASVGRKSASHHADPDALPSIVAELAL